VTSGCLVPPRYFFQGSGAPSSVDNLLVRACGCFGGWGRATAIVASGCCAVTPRMGRRAGLSNSGEALMFCRGDV